MQETGGSCNGLGVKGIEGSQKSGPDASAGVRKERGGSCDIAEMSDSSDREKLLPATEIRKSGSSS